ncbi:MAG: helix-turn-helix transcriptional regulator, partial [Halanaerobiales bacterium]
MKIGEKIRSLRIKNQLTQEELANRCELSKGFISQVERDLTSPSIATLLDILECLGTNIKDFFNEPIDEKIVFKKDDIFIRENPDLKYLVQWLV